MSDLKFSTSLTELPFSKIFFKLAVPNLYSTLIASLTVIFDLWYVGQIGVSQLAGVAYIFPIYMLTSMLSNGAFGGAVSGATARAFGSRNIFLLPKALAVAPLTAPPKAPLDSMLVSI